MKKEPSQVERGKGVGTPHVGGALRGAPKLTPRSLNAIEGERRGRSKFFGSFHVNEKGPVSERVSGTIELTTWDQTGGETVHHPGGRGELKTGNAYLASDRVGEERNQREGGRQVVLSYRGER